MAKPIDEHTYHRYIRSLGWTLEKGGIDYNLYDQDYNFLCSIKIEHGKGRKREISATSVRKTQKLCDERGIIWPPRKK